MLDLGLCVVVLALRGVKTPLVAILPPKTLESCNI